MSRARLAAMARMGFGRGVLALALVAAAPAVARDFVVRDQRAYAAAAAKVRPGDRILLADGEWRDFGAVLDAEGRPDRPITLRAEHPGKAVLTGRSSLRVAGKHLVVADLVFRDGFAPGKEAVATRIGKRWAEHLRLTGIVIDRFNNPDRRQEDHWVSLYGADIRVDHSHFVGKSNAGAMLVVVRDKPYPLDNRIALDHNFFGPRPVLGSNGGETIRVGTSDEAMSDSHSLIEENWFERCDGEVEIISIKSGANVIRGNVFTDSQGAVVLRHGNGNLVERNVFLGHGLPRTGGVRVINERQTVRGNYMEGLGGVDFTSAITVMNGVPNSPINRYLPVKDALIERNSVVDVARVTLAAGADAERSQPPSSTRFAGNLFVSRERKDPFRAEGDIGGIAFSGNVADFAPRLPGVAVQRRPVELARAANGLLYPTDPTVDAGAPRDLRPVAREETGVPWYPKPGAGEAALFGSGATIRVKSGAALAGVVRRARNGDVVRLAAGRYHLAEPLVIDRALTLAGRGATLTFAAPTLFQLEEGGALRLSGLTVSGAAAPRAPGNAVVRSSARPMLANWVVELIDCRFQALNGAPGFDVVATTPATLARLVAIRGGAFADVSGAVVAGRSETGDQGFYNAEEVAIEGASFDRVGAVADLFRGGADESTYGPRFAMTRSTVANSGPIRLSGVQWTAITGNRFLNSAGVEVAHSVGSPHTTITGNVFAATPAPVVRELRYKGPPRALVADNRSTS